jgi:uncharacterized protein (TIGR02453 family)
MTELQITLDFLRRLALNNNKAWFDANRREYEQAQMNFNAFLSEIIRDFEPVESLHGMTPKDFTFRINRDVRFSADKSPYKTNMGAALRQGGKNGRRMPYYIHLQPGDCFLGGGLYMPDSEQLKRIREQLAHNAREFEQILAAPDFVEQFGGLRGEKLKSAPKGYPAEHPAIDLLRHKQFLVMRSLSEREVTASDFAPQVIAAFKVMKPFNEYLNRVLGF